jgi:hypothetical protein
MQFTNSDILARGGTIHARDKMISAWVEMIVP